MHREFCYLINENYIVDAFRLICELNLCAVYGKKMNIRFRSEFLIENSNSNFNSN